MRIIDIDTLFVNIDDEIKGLENIKEYLDLKRYKVNEVKMKPSEYLTLILLFRFGHNKNLKSIWHEHKYFKRDFPNMPSYNVFITWVNRLKNLLIYLLEKRLYKLQNELGIIDSTKIETSRPYRRGKIHRQASRGYSSLGAFNGFKLHLLINKDNQICAYKITTASVHDISVVKEGFLDFQTGKVLADSGYVGREVYYNLMDKNLTLIAKPRNNMIENNELGLGYLPDWNLNFKKLYKKRMLIERLFDFFKDKLNLVVNKLHSTKSLYVHVFSTLLASQLLFNNELSYQII